MTVKVTKPQINLREKISEVDKPSGVAGEAVLRAETPQEVFNYINAGRRNVIINGAMQVWQRGTSFNIPENNGTFTADRWRYRDSVADNGNVTISKSSDTPSGFGSSILVSSDSPEPNGVSGTEYARFQYYFEGQDIQHIFTGDENAKPITVSFWVKCVKAGQLTLGLELPYSSYTICLRKFYINSPNTWEYKTLTFPPTTRVVANDNSNGMRLTLCTAVSEDNWKGLEEGVWSTSGSYYQGSLGDMNIYRGVSGDLFWLTGFQLEAGKVATPFEHRSYGEELALCQRYYYLRRGAGGQRHVIGYAPSTSQFNGVIDFPITMRTTPTLITSGTTTDYTLVHATGGVVNIGSLPTYGGTEDGGYILCTGASGLTAGSGAQLRSANSSGFLAFEAEL